MQKWEYVIEKPPMRDSDGRQFDLNMFLNERGKDGWELIDVSVCGTVGGGSTSGSPDFIPCHWLIFKRLKI